MTDDLETAFTEEQRRDLIDLYAEVEAEVLARVLRRLKEIEGNERRLARQPGLPMAARRRYIERADALMGAANVVRADALGPKAGR